MAAGCPVITCRNASIPEVAGDAAMYVDDADVQEMVRALEAVQIADVREKLVNAGFAQAKKFSWSQVAKEFSSYIQTTVEGLAAQKGNKDAAGKQARDKDNGAICAAINASRMQLPKLKESWRTPGESLLKRTAAGC